MLKIKNELKL